MKKAFTLVELLGVIAILGVIALITYPIVGNILTGAKKGMSDVQKKAIVEAARTWGMNNSNLLNEDSPYYLYVSQLNESKLIETSNIIDPSTGKETIGCVEIKYDINYKQYDYKFVNDCSNGDNTGLITTVSKEEDLLLENSVGKNLLDYKIYGNSYQETRSGKNLILNSEINDLTGYGVRGTTYTLSKDSSLFNGHNILKIVGTSAGVAGGTDISIKLSSMPSTNTTYMFSCWVKSTVSTTMHVRIGYGATNNTVNLTANNWTKIKVLVGTGTTQWQELLPYFESAGTFYISEPQFEIGTTATDFEHSGISPSPEIPSKIKSLGDKGSINILIKSRNEIINSSFNDGWNGYRSHSSLWTIIDAETDKPRSKIVKATQTGMTTNNIPSLYTNVITARKGDKFVYSIDFKVDDANAWDMKYPFIFEVYDSSGKRIEYTDVSIGQLGISSVVSGKWYRGTYTRTVNSDQASFVAMRGSLFRNGTLYLREPQIVKYTGNSYDSLYVDYKLLTSQIFLSNPLQCVGDVCDYIDFANKRIVKKIGVKIFDGTESWVARGDIPGLYVFSDSAMNVLSSDNNICRSNYYLCSSYYANKNYQISMGGVVHGKDRVMLFNSNYIGSDNLKSWLSSKKTEGNPVTVYYQLATPTYEPIDLPDIPTLNGDTIISVTDGTINGKIEAKYYKGM